MIYKLFNSPWIFISHGLLELDYTVEEISLDKNESTLVISEHYIKRHIKLATKMERLKYMILAFSNGKH